MRFIPALVLPLALVAMVFAFAVMLCAVAHGEDAALCRPYARALTDLVIRWTWERAFHICENAEGMPTLPPDGLAALRSVMPEATPVWPLEREQVDALKSIGVIPASGPPTPPARPEADSKPVDAHASGWAAKCARTHPRGWDAATGTITVRQGRKWVRVPCPD